MTRVAAVDCGTNSIRLLIADAPDAPDAPDVADRADSADGADRTDRLREVTRRTVVVRLGQGVDATGEFHPDALRRTFAATDEFATLIRQAAVPPDAIHFVATSAARDARNRQAFFDGIEQRLGVVPEVISGDREADLSFTGALISQRSAAGPVLVMDLGGGSTELILGSPTGTIAAATSLDVGSVRLTERFLGSPPSRTEDLDRAAAHIDALLDGAGLDLAGVTTWVGVAGTVTTLAALDLGLAVYDRSRVHGTRLTHEAIDRWLNRLAASTLGEIRALPSMHPGRADVITAGALVVQRVGLRVGAPGLVVSETDILDGIALALLERSQQSVRHSGMA